ncbi:MAG: hypothetical protein AAGL68_06525 [Pseudomonadota bacterium]
MVTIQSPLFRIGAAIAGAFVLSGCLGSGDKYPSLAVRDGERIAGTFEPVTRPPAAPVSNPAVLAGLPAIEARADSAYEAFQVAIPGVESAIASARGSSPESNQWAAAQIALAELDSQHSQTAIALADIDLIYAEASSEFALGQEIAELRAKVAVQVMAQDQILRALRQQVSP